ncbi:MAG TPA: 50S ribosomal protein L34e [Candidatus Atribacteria bacterium]|nr:50S ribosomal protein L34e [Candidatus Atribacteria bacterium]
MVSPVKRRLKKIFRRTPGGRVAVHYVREKRGKHVCAICGAPLHGVPHRKSPSKVRKLAKTERRPERVFGGVLCPGCTRRVLEEAFYAKRGAMDISNIDMRDRKYVLMAMKVVG